MAFSPPTPFSPQSPESLIFSPSPRSRDSIQSVSTSNTSLESDDVMIVTDDPHYDEHPHSHQSQVCVADDSPVIHVPPFHAPLLYVNTQPPVLGFDYVYGMGLKSPPPVKPRQGISKSSVKQKALKFKSWWHFLFLGERKILTFHRIAKPCKFFPTEKGCPNGSSCTL